MLSVQLSVKDCLFQIWILLATGNGYSVQFHLSDNRTSKTMIYNVKWFVVTRNIVYIVQHTQAQKLDSNKILFVIRCSLYKWTKSRGNERWQKWKRKTEKIVLSNSSTPHLHPESIKDKKKINTWFVKSV